MDEDTTPTQHTDRLRGRTKLAAVLGAAVLAIPGGALVSNAFAAESDAGSTTAPTQQVQETTPEAPSQQERPEDCPEKDGEGSGSGSSDSSGSTTAPTTAL